MRKKSKAKWVIIVVVIVLIISGGYWYIEAKMMPNVLTMGRVQMENLAGQIIDEAVNETTADITKMDDLVEIKTDAEGNIQMIQANMVKVNQVATDTGMIVREKLAQIDSSDIQIHWGNVIGGPLLSGRGPLLDVRVEPVGAVNTEYLTEFESVGINQTRHRIYLKVNAYVEMIIGSSSTTVNVSTEVQIAEAIIVGKVPQTYLHSSSLNDMLNLVP